MSTVIIVVTVIIVITLCDMTESTHMPNKLNFPTFIGVRSQTYTVYANDPIIVYLAQDRQHMLLCPYHKAKVINMGRNVRKLYFFQWKLDWSRSLLG